MGTVTIGDKTYTHRSLTFIDGVEVWCPYHDKEVDVMEWDGCLPEVEGCCEYLSSVAPGVIVCLWTEADGRAEK